MSLPELLQQVLRPDLAPAPVSPLRADGNALAAAALVSLPLGLRLWLAREGLTLRTIASFPGLSILPAHLSGASFDSASARVDSIAALLSSNGVACDFLSLPDLGITDDWGRSTYAFDDDVSGLKVVLAAVDHFITLCDGPLPSPWMVFDPVPRFTEPLDWQTGMPHRPRERAVWKRIPGAKSWAKRMLKYHFWTKPSVPIRSRISKNSRALRRSDPAFDVDQFRFVEQKLAEEVQQSVVVPQAERPAVTSAILCVPKSDSKEKFRKVENMSNFKENFAPVHFKLETMQQFSTVFGPRFWLFKLDFKAAYHNFLVRKCFREFFGVEFDGKYYTYSALPFGFRMSAFWLNKMVKVVATFLRSQGYAILPYMDDGIYGSHTFVRAVRYRNYVVRLWESLGLRFSPSVGKCLLTPTQSLEGLGVVAHLAAACPTFHMPSRKVDVYVAESRALLDLPDLWPILKLARVAGLLMSSALAIPVSKLLCRPLFECMYVGSGVARSEARKRLDWASLVRSSPDARHELRWLLDNVVRENARGAPIWLASAVSHLCLSGPELVLSQDASRRGAGWLVHCPGSLRSPCDPLSSVLLICWEYFSGSGSGSLAFLLANESNALAVVVMVDILEVAVATRYIPARFLAAGRVLYFCAAAGEIVDVRRFEHLVACKWPGATLQHLVKMILTPPCTTLSTASRFRDSAGLPGHPSRPHGVNGPGLLPAAMEADLIRSRVSVVAREVADALPDTVRIVWENPVGLYRHTSDANMLLAHCSPGHTKRWRLVTLCHCLHADPDVPTSNKPTDYLCFGFGDIPSESCDGSCSMCIPGTSLHRFVISNSPRDGRQERLEGYLRERVPAGIYDYIDTFRDTISPVDSSFFSSACAYGTVRFTPSESAMHQAALELYGLAMSFRAASTRPELRGKRFRVRVDAMVTVWYFKNHGGRSPLLNRIFRFLWEQLRAVGSTIVDMVHVAGAQFVAEGTDLLSRPPFFPENSVADRDEWRLEQQWFLRIQNWAGCELAADLFADRDNHRLPVFFSAAICADAAGLPDCFANPWPVGVSYAFPPLHLTPRVVQHALDTDSHLVLLVPNWPSQPWWPKLMSITTRSWLVGRKSDLFSRRAQSGEAWGYVPVLRPFFELLVCRVHASSAAASSSASADISSGLRLTAVAASDPVVGSVPRIRCPPETLVPPM